jgi:hypothetical protein
MSSWNPFYPGDQRVSDAGQPLECHPFTPGPIGDDRQPNGVGRDARPRTSLVGHISSRWIFAGEHHFLLDQTSDGATRLTHGERFSGLLAPLIMRGRLLSATEQGFAAMKEALKRRSE